MRCIYRWSGERWKMQYPLTDNSSIEKAAVRKAFEKEKHVKNHLLCTVHTEQTLQRNFKSEDDKPAYELLRQAMRSLTEENCLLLCSQAITTASSEKKRQYIRKELISTCDQWAMYARQHSQILLQVTSSNACEAWHCKLKNGAGQKKGDTSAHGIFGCVRTVHDCAHEVENNVRSAEIESRTKQVTVVKSPGYSGLQMFRYSIHQIVAIEHSKLSIRLMQQVPIPARQLVDGLYACNCLFSRRYQLPCQHIFHIDHAYRADHS